MAPVLVRSTASLNLLRPSPVLATCCSRRHRTDSLVWRLSAGKQLPDAGDHPRHSGYVAGGALPTAGFRPVGRGTHRTGCRRWRDVSTRPSAAQPVNRNSAQFCRFSRYFVDFIACNRVFPGLFECIAGRPPHIDNKCFFPRFCPYFIELVAIFPDFTYFQLRPIHGFQRRGRPHPVE